MAELFTVGYTSFSVLEMIEVLRDYGINVIIDVRSSPYSSHYPDYNKESFEHILKENSIYYRSYAQEFGAQQTDKRFFSSKGFLDFELFTKSECFLQGFKKIQANIEKNFTIGLMCAEKDPAECHRSIMVSRVLFEKGLFIKHILSNRKFETQRDIELRLLNKYFPDRNQVTLFGNDLSDAELIKNAYRRRNSEIGFRIEDKKHEPLYSRIYEEVCGTIL